MAVGSHLTSHELGPEQLMAFLDGELPAQQMSTASEHLRQCRDCQALAANFQGLSIQLSEWQVPWSDGASMQCPQNTKADQSQLFSSNFQSWWRQYRWRFSAGVLALALVIILVSQFRSTPHVSEPPFVSGVVAPSGMQTSNRSRQSERMASPSLGFVTASTAPEVPLPTPGPMIARAAELRITVVAIAPIRDTVMAIVAVQKGYISRLDLNESPSTGRSLRVTIQVPADHLDATLESFKHVGRIESESQAGEDISKQMVDVGARLANLRNEEGRLNQILRERTGKLADVLAVEEQISRVREQVEMAAAEEKNLVGRVAYASLQLTVSEEYRKALTGNETSTLTRLHNAAIEGFQQVVNVLLGTLVFFLANGPTLLLLGGLSFLAYRMFARYRRVAR